MENEVKKPSDKIIDELCKELREVYEVGGTMEDYSWAEREIVRRWLTENTDSPDPFSKSEVIEKMEEEIENLLDGDPDNGIRAMGIRSAIIILQQTPSRPSQGVDKGCGICGGKMVQIRGQYPKDGERRVCPTCCYERLEQIRQIADKNYGVAMQCAPCDSGERHELD